MGALLDDAPVVEDDDLVGITDGGEAMGDDKGGAPLHDGVHAHKGMGDTGMRDRKYQVIVIVLLH